jgi:hypothetical protein
MTTVEKRLKNASERLNLKLKELEVLDIEKQDIMKRYEKASSKEREAIQVEMAESIERYKNLADEVHKIHSEVKSLRAESEQ